MLFHVVSISQLDQDKLTFNLHREQTAIAVKRTGRFSVIVFFLGTQLCETSRSKMPLNVLISICFGAYSFVTQFYSFCNHPPSRYVLFCWLKQNSVELICQKKVRIWLQYLIGCRHTVKKIFRTIVICLLLQQPAPCSTASDDLRGVSFAIDSRSR